MSKPTNVEEYLSTIPEEVNDLFLKTRDTIISLLPDADEVISYGIPTYKVNGKTVVHLGAFKKHCSLFPGGKAVSEVFADELQGYKVSAGTIQFTNSKPLPKTLLKKIIKYRLELNAQ